MLQPGEKAPDFKLFNTEKKEVALSDYKGKNVVVLFFPLAFTSVCTAELCEMRDNISTYAALNATVIGISVDSPYTLARFKEDQNLPFDLLSDFNHDTSETYDTLHETFGMNMKNVSKRSAFVIDGNGIIQYVEVLDNPGNVPNFVAIQDVLSTLK